MKTVILDFTGNESARKLKEKINAIRHFDGEDTELIEDDDVRIISDVIAKNKNYISDMFVVILGNSNFNTSKIRYKKALSLTDEEHLIDMCEEEVATKNAEIEALKAELTAVKEENRKLKNALNSKKYSIESYKNLKRETGADNAVSLNVGDVQELYEGEVKDYILKLLDKELHHAEANPKTRKYNVLKTIVDLNESTEMSNDIAELFEKALNNDGSLDYTMKPDLEELHFKVTKGKKSHTKITSPEGYSIVVCATGSDNHAKANNISYLKLTFLLL